MKTRKSSVSAAVLAIMLALPALTPALAYDAKAGGPDTSANLSPGRAMERPP